MLPTFVPGLKTTHFLETFTMLTDTIPLNSVGKIPSLRQKNDED